MSNRDGKQNTTKYRIGGKCPRCKGRLERVYDKKHPKKHWRDYFCCDGCHLTNF
jgi:hypothetical protein